MKPEDFVDVQQYIDWTVSEGWKVISDTTKGTITTLREVVLIKHGETTGLTQVMRVSQRYYPHRDSFDTLEIKTYHAWEIFSLADALEKAGIKWG